MDISISIERIENGWIVEKDLEVEQMGENPKAFYKTRFEALKAAEAYLNGERMKEEFNSGT